jgi:hypothetical protein
MMLLNIQEPPQMADEEPPDQRKADDEYRTKLRDLVKHENEVMNQRTTWLMVSQGIFATAAASLIGEYPLPTIFVAVVAATIAISIWHSLSNSFDSRKHFKDLWRDRIKKRGYTEEEALPVDGGYQNNRAIGWLLPDRIIPKVVVTAWVVVIAYSVAKMCGTAGHLL